VRHAIAGAQPLYREGEPSDEIDLVAAGRLVVTLGEGTPQVRRVRSISTHTVVGEMGFFRHAARSATVSSEGPALLFTLTRAHFERMRAERPDLASAFHECLLRTLSDRIGLSERMLMSLGR
jgi:SulP family sulfate permease